MTASGKPPRSKRSATSPSSGLNPRQALGAEGESLAAAWYEAQGYQILARNWRCPDGELDIVARGRGVLVFCEVKTRSSARFGAPAEAVNHAKQRRLRRLALAYLAASGAHAPQLRFDVASVLRGNLEIIQDAF